MGAAVSMAAAPFYCCASLCATCTGSFCATALCKACSCACTASARTASCLYYGMLMVCVGIAIGFRNNDGDIVIGGSWNASRAWSLSHQTSQIASNYWNERSSCGPAHPHGFVICCSNVCGGVFAVYRFSFALCLFFACLTLCTVGTSRFGARAHRGFWFVKLFLLVGLVISSIFIDNEAMASYREVARYVSFLWLIAQAYLLIDFGYKTNEYFVDLDDKIVYDGCCTYKMGLLVSAVFLYAISIVLWILEANWFGAEGCGAQQTMITLTIIFTLVLTAVSTSNKIAPHGTLLVSAIVTWYATFQAYSALASHPDPHCNATSNSSIPETAVGFVVFAVAMGSMAASAWSATSSKDALIGKSSTSNSDLTVTIANNEGGTSSADAEGENSVECEAWWYYHLMMVVVSLYFAMLITDWSTQPMTKGPIHEDFNHSLSVFWIKIGAQWVTLAMYAWTLLAPWIFKDVRDFGVEFDY